MIIVTHHDHDGHMYYCDKLEAVTMLVLSYYFSIFVLIHFDSPLHFCNDGVAILLFQGQRKSYSCKLHHNTCLKLSLKCTCTYVLD